MKTGIFFPGKKSKMKKSPTFFYNLAYESYEKSPVMKLRLQQDFSKQNIETCKNDPKRNVMKYTRIIFSFFFDFIIGTTFSYHNVISYGLEKRTFSLTL